MKQTNNAIKFLMAQYRAIFRNANLKMFLAAATAAAALSAGSANAATPLDNDKLSAELKKAADEAVFTVDGTGSEPDTFNNLTLSGGAAPGVTLDSGFSGNSFTINVTGGNAHTIDGDSSDEGVVNAKKGKLVINGDAAKVTVGGQSGSTVSLAGLDVAKGTLVIGKDAAAGNAVVNAGSITLGVKPADPVDPQGKAAATAKVELASKGSLGGADTTSIDVYTGAEITVSGASTTNATVKATNINFKGGSLDIKNQQGITLDGTVDVAAAEAATIKNAGTITLTKDATFGMGSIKQEATGILTTATDFDSDLSLNFDAADYANVLAGKIDAKFKSNTNHSLKLDFKGDAAVDLTKIFAAADGTVTGDKVKYANGSLSLSAQNATFTDGVKFDLDKVSYSFNTLTTGKTNAFAVNKGNLTIKDKLDITGKTTTLTVSGANATPVVLTLDRTGGVASGNGLVTAGTIKVSGEGLDSSKLNVKNGTWDVNALEIVKGTVNVDAATLNVKGKLTTTKDTGLLKASNASVVNAYGAGALALGGSGSITLSNSSTLVLKTTDVFTKDDTKDSLTVTAAAFASGAVTANSNSKIKFQADDSGSGVTLTETQYQSLLDGTKFTGLFEGVEVEGITAKADMELKDVKSGLSGKYDDTVVEVGTDGVSGGTYDFGAVKLKSGTESLKLADGGNLSLVNANSSTGNGNFVTKTDADGNAVAANVVLAGSTGNGLTLAGSGKIGSITLDASAPVGQSSVQFGDEKNAGAVTVAGTVGANAKELGNVVILGSDVTVQSGDVYAYNVDIQGGSLKLDDTKSFVIGKDATELASTIKGDVSADNFTVKGNSGSLLIAGDAKLELGTITGAKGVAINIGQDGVKNGSASVVADKLVLNDGGLFIDPDYDQTKASAVVMNLSGAATNVSAGTLDGKVAVGKNAAFGVGFNSLAEMDEAIGSYLTSGHFTMDTTNGGVHNALVLNKQISLDATKGGISVGETATLATTTAKTVKFGDNSALVITDNVFVDNGGVKTGTAISGADNVSFGTGSELVLVGDFNAKDDSLDIFGSTVTPTGTMTVKSLNGLLEGTWNKGLLDLNLTTDQKILDSAFVDSAAPIRDLLLDSKKGELGAGAGLGRDLINEVSSVSLSGAVADAAAHAATYAGAQQAAVAAVGTMAEAVGGRVGSMGVEAATIAATGSQANGGVWLSPMYKSVDADGFNAQGGSYGADVDLAGVAFGADTVNGNMRFGAVFNIGSGDADGKGNGNGLKDEFDYYGFGIYSVMGFGNLALVGDASLNVISHDVEGLGLKGEADTTAVTMGITGQYTIANPMVDVTPHLGARFIRLDTDSYDLTNAKGTVATTDFEVQNVFSVPLGVTLSKAFEMGGWSLAPSADLSITFNTGDTEVDSTTRFTGINRNIGLNTEVLDEVTYGVAVGLGAQYGAFGTQIGINYTGSENTDAFGVNANARYMF